MPYTDLRKGRYSEMNREYFITTVVNNRRPVFRDFRFARLLVSNLRQWEKTQELQIQAWVIMPDHLHLLVTQTGTTDLSTMIKQLKGVSSRNLNQALNRKGTFWQPGFYDHALRKEEDRKQIARYIVANPLRAGLVHTIGEYPHWDSIWL
ncbi:MAG: Transposase and inactivated derivatives [uncultured Thiotrichaceae bacterium]|uniref:Transposase and inactivated derivatives n=1 Tax=uncultured Thiotrichaceae bacterium TaxID=298394 RepID=A0A6S6SCD5_9GAMM|nr:MAG: Transposase and inactivated derivatives [uncultured Thiotrichaceae bacterium]